MKGLRAVALTVLLTPLAALAAPPAVTWEADLESSTQAGHLTLEWNSSPLAAGENYELQQASKADFSDATTIYKGPDTASFRSGLAEGTRYFRVRAVASDGKAGLWSEEHAVEVRYQSMRLAWILFGLGALVFGAVVRVVVKGADSQPSASGRGA